MKLGQVTLFIILGLIIVATIVMGVFLKEQISGTIKEPEFIQATKLKQEAGIVTDMVEGCIEDLALEGMSVILSQGGYLYVENGIDVYAMQVPYYSSYGNDRSPSLAEVQDSLETYVDQMLPFCLGGFEEIEGFEVEALGNPESGAEFKEGTVDVYMSYSLKISRDDVSDRLKSFSASIEMDALTPYNGAMELFRKVDSGIFDTGLAEFVEGKEYKLGVEEIGDTTVYALKFMDIKINGEAVVYPFAVKSREQKASADDVSGEAAELLGMLLSLPELFDSEGELPEEDFDDLEAEMVENLDQYEGGVF